MTKDKTTNSDPTPEVPEHNFLVGQRVTLVVDSPTGAPATGIIRVVQSEVGKLIGVELDEWINYAHSLDGAIEAEKYDESANIVVGKGWWTRPENIAKI